MTVTAVKRVELSSRVGEELEPYERLVELQRQMMTLVQQNAEAERECAVLRAHLAREAEALFLSRRSLLARLEDRSDALLRRLFKQGKKKAGAGSRPAEPQPGPGPRGWVCRLADDPATQP